MFMQYNSLHGYQHCPPKAVSSAVRPMSRASGTVGVWGVVVSAGWPAMVRDRMAMPGRGSLTLAVFARRAPARVARLMNVAWILTALPPLADLLLHRAAEKPAIGYLLADPEYRVQ